MGVLDPLLTNLSVAQELLGVSSHDRPGTVQRGTAHHVLKPLRVDGHDTLGVGGPRDLKHPSSVTSSQHSPHLVIVRLLIRNPRIRVDVDALTGLDERHALFPDGVQGAQPQEVLLHQTHMLYSIKVVLTAHCLASHQPHFWYQLAHMILRGGNDHPGRVRTNGRLHSR